MMQDILHTTIGAAELREGDFRLALETIAASKQHSEARETARRVLVKYNMEWTESGKRVSNIFAALREQAILDEKDTP